MRPWPRRGETKKNSHPKDLSFSIFCLGDSHARRKFKVQGCSRKILKVIPRSASLFSLGSLFVLFVLEGSSSSSILFFAFSLSFSFQSSFVVFLLFLGFRKGENLGPNANAAPF